MEKQVKIGNLAHEHESETAKQTLVKSVKATEKRLLKAKKLTRLVIGSAIVMTRYKAFYSLDCNDGIENAAIGWAQPSPEDYLIEKEELAEYEELIRRLYEAISSLPPMQARRVHARYMLGMKVKDIAAMEGITPSQAGKSIHAALRRLRRYFARQKWTVNL